MDSLLRWPWFALAVACALGAPAATRADEKDPHADLIGKPAADFKGDFALNGKPTTLADLKGKVVLLDFWAVWCGPCRATFPHLIEWNKEYKEKGLTIVGLTTYYEQIGFDTKKGELIRLKGSDKLTKEKEEEMLKDFAVHYKLDYTIMAASKEDLNKAYKEYKVEGIPQVVLIDRKGVVRMIKVGSGDENAKALGEMIKKLVEEK